VTSPGTLPVAEYFPAPSYRELGWDPEDFLPIPEVKMRSIWWLLRAAPG